MKYAMTGYEFARVPHYQKSKFDGAKIAMIEKHPSFKVLH
jgi:hypothetical protein